MKKVISLIIVLFISVSSLSLTMTAAKETGDFVCGIWKYSVYPDHVTITGVTTPVSGKIEIPAELDGHKYSRQSHLRRTGSVFRLHGT